MKKHLCTEGAGIIALGGGRGREKKRDPLFFSLPLKPLPPSPLSSFDTHARRQPVTGSARSRRSHGKIENCEQSTAWEATASQSQRRSKIIKIIPLHGFGMLNLVPRAFSFSGMPVAERPLPPGNKGWGILCNHSYSAMNFSPEGLPRLQATESILYTLF